MIGRLLVVAGGVAAGAVAAAAVWARRKAELDEQAREAGVDMPVIPDPADERERGLTPLAPEADVAADPGDAGDRSDAAEGAVGADTSGAADDLQTVKGIGDVSERRLAEQGITTFAQIAAWSDVDLEAVAGAIKVSPERMRREDWVGQARAISEATS